MAERFEYYITGDNTYNGFQGDTWYAQTFTPTTAHKILSVKLKLLRANSPGDITVSIRETDGEGHPTGIDLCSGTTNGNTLTTDTAGEWREITLGDGADLNADQKYAIVVRALDASGSNYPFWRYDSADATYVGGNYEYSGDGGSDWGSQAGMDYMFEDWGEPVGVAYEKTLTESLGLLDKVVKAPSVVKTEPLGLLDTYSRTWAAYRVYSESLGLSDTVVKAPALMKTEALGLVDTVIATRLLVKVLTELLGLSDTVKKDAFKVLTDNLGLVDAVAKGVALHPLSETLALLDSRVLSIQRTYTESLGLEDRVSKHVSLHALTEVLGLLDSISYLPNPTILAKLIRKLIQVEDIGGGGQN